MRKLLKLGKVERGLPCKSYIHIVNLDIELKRFLSYVNESDYFNQFVCNKLVRQYRYKDRQKVSSDFIDFMATYDSDRINFIFSNKVLSRYLCISLLNLIYTGIIKYKNIKKQILKGHQPSQSDTDFYIFFQKNWLTNKPNFIKQVSQSYNYVTEFVNSLMTRYQSFIIKYLLSNRRGNNDPSMLKTDMYELVMTLINVYDYRKSKMTFHNVLRFYIANQKNKIIQYETWGLENLIYLDSIPEKSVLYDTPKIKNSDVTEDSSGSVLSVRNNIWNEVEKALYFERKQEDKYRLIELSYQALPTSLRQITSILFELVDPLEIEQEIALALKQKLC